MIRDLGVWSHYAGLHVTVHFDGWGRLDNPRGFSIRRGLHAEFEGAFVKANVRREAVKAAMAPYSACRCDFATGRLAESASVLRDLIVDAWRASADHGVGYPIIAVRDIEAGRHILTRDDFGRD